MSEPVLNATLELRSFLFEAVYENPRATAEFEKAVRHPRRPLGEAPRPPGAAPRPGHDRRRGPRRGRPGLPGRHDRPLRRRALRGAVRAEILERLTRRVVGPRVPPAISIVVWHGRRKAGRDVHAARSEPVTERRRNARRVDTSPRRSSWTARTSGSSRRSSSRGEARKDAKKVRLTGRVVTTLECDCSRCLEPFPVPVDAKVDVAAACRRATTAAQAEQEIARRRPRRVVLQGRRHRPGRADARAVLPGGADEAVVPRGLPGLVPGVRHQPQPRDVLVPGRRGSIRAWKRLKSFKTKG